MKNVAWALLITATAISSTVFAAGGSFVGLLGGNLTAERASQLKLDGLSGAEIVSVRALSPAAKADLRPGDVVIGLNGGSIEGIAQLKTTIESTPAGHWRKFSVIRKGEPVTIVLQTVPIETAGSNGPAIASLATPIQAEGSSAAAPSGDSAGKNCRDGAMKAGGIVLGVGVVACTLNLFVTGGAA
jgi:predicted metalloprotease with PDZ domain